MISDEIRSSFLKFFESKGHTVIPSSSLIPQGDPTLLLTTAGMVQFKPYFLGEQAPPNRRMASCQKCFRTTDIESVGDASHLTFFEMLGNFSIGDYFKKEAIAWGWEFVTKYMKLPPERLWITVYLDDDEAFGYWREIGVPESRIKRFGKKENFWGPAGNSGPCGPCSEIHYDFGEGIGCGKPDCGPNCCARYSEIWNLVFTQYNQDEAGKLTPLPKPNIDTGMGLERAVTVVTGKTSVYQTDLFTPLLERVAGLAGKKYGGDAEMDNAIRIVAEHGRGLTFLIADGVLPSNEGRGYVLRRLLRRAALFGRRLKQDQPFLTEIVRTTVKKMGQVYPEVAQRQDFIIKVIEQEEARFKETLTTGLELIDNVLAKEDTRWSKAISGEDAFRLYDTYGFPVELTREIVSRSGFTVDMAGFQEEMEKQRERARATQKFDNKEVFKPGELGIAATSFVGYENLGQKSKIVRLLRDDEIPPALTEGQKGELVLDSTPFYGEMGGQMGDTGEIRGPSGRFVVTNTIHPQPAVTLHRGYVAEGTLAVGDEVLAQVDRERRLDIARNHTATHLLQSALREVLGKHVEQRGSLVAPERLRFDFSHLTALTREELQKVQRIVNDKVRQDLPVYSEKSSYKQAIAAGAMALFSEKYGETVRVMKIGRPIVSAELCGGTHVTSTGEIGYVHILSEGGIGAGLRRIEAVTGREAEAFVNEALGRLEKVGQLVGASTDKVEEKLSAVLAELDRERKRCQALEGNLARNEAEVLLGKIETIKGVPVLIAKVSPQGQQALREMADFIREKLKSAVIVLGTVYEDRPAFLAAVTPDLVEKGYNAGNIIKQVARVAGGGGGGKPNLAQAGGKDKDKVDDALRLAKTLI